MLMIHNPSTLAWGDRDDMQKAIDVLDSVRETLINAYQLKTGLSHAKLVQMVDDETWMDAKQAIKLGFCDGMMTRKNADPDEGPEKELEDPDEEPDEEKKPTDGSAHMFAAAAYIRTVTNKLSKLAEPKAPAAEPEVTEDLTSAAALMQRLQNIKNQF
jgi:ATP-dependent Clp protease protease subunit